MRIGAFAVVLVLAAFADSSAHATPQPAIPPTPPPTQLVREPCPDDPRFLGCASASAIYIDASVAEDSRDFREIWRHERGHQADLHFLDDAERTYFTELINGTMPWYSASYWGAPGEKFADAYVACRRNKRPGWRRIGRRIWVHEVAGSGYEPSESLHRSVCAWMTGIGSS